MKAFWRFGRRRRVIAKPRLAATGRVSEPDPEPHNRRALLILAHPALQRSRVNAALYAAVADMADAVTFHDLYESYADFSVDVEIEQQRLAEHDLIILQFPMYWYATPALLKEWLDMVWLHGFAYGRSGTRLHGKTMLCAVTTGGEPEAYTPSGRNRFPIEEFLRPMEATAYLCGLAWADPFIVHDTFQIDDAGIAIQAARYRKRIAELIAALPATSTAPATATAA
jgi:glutathione-regulated potassium-efflux system ancillary protein KefG